MSAPTRGVDPAARDLVGGGVDDAAVIRESDERLGIAVRDGGDVLVGPARQEGVGLSFAGAAGKQIGDGRWINDNVIVGRLVS